MIIILGKKYISDKECSKRFGYSKEWFIKKRNKNLPPPYIKLDSGKVLYELDAIEDWFKKQLNKI
jgi:predicted DNA-binding transcriptional regulator AlpA